jgi:endoglucanase
VQSESGDSRNYSDDANNTLSAGFFSELDARVYDFLDRDMAVILYFFEAGGFETGTDQWKTVFVNLWTQIADHYKDAPPRLVFQPINESPDNLDAVLTDWYAVVTDAIRATNPTRIIVYSPPFWGKGDLAELTIPASAGQYYMGGVHPYEPYCYTHQGWGDCGNGIHWSETPENTDPVDTLLNSSQAWSSAHDEPVVADEWGTGNTPDAGEQVAWAEYVRDACFSRGFAFTYFDFVDQHDWGIYNLGSNEWYNNALVDVLTGGTAPWD